MFWKFEPYLYEHFISYCATAQYGVIIPYMNSDWRRKNSGLPRGRGGRGVWGEFRRARAFRRSEAEAVSSVQRMFEQSCIIPQEFVSDGKTALYLCYKYDINERNGGYGVAVAHELVELFVWVQLPVVTPQILSLFTFKSNIELRIHLLYTISMQLILYGLIGSLFALIGGVLVLLWAEKVKKVMTPLLAFSAAAFLGVSFLDLLPEAVEAVEESLFIFIAFLVGISLFFILERVIMKYFHRHAHEHHEHTEKENEHTESLPALIIIGDCLHNFLDGVAIAAAFVANPALGLTTALAVAAHEVPQEIGDFAILLDRGWSRMKVFGVNVLASATAFIGIIVGYFTISAIEEFLPYLLAGVAGIFTYIALSDLIPEVHHRAGHRYIYNVLFAFILGLALVGYIVTVTHL